jgi:hypothetical protein
MHAVTTAAALPPDFPDNIGRSPCLCTGFAASGWYLGRHNERGANRLS